MPIDRVHVTNKTIAVSAIYSGYTQDLTISQFGKGDTPKAVVLQYTGIASIASPSPDGKMSGGWGFAHNCGTAQECAVGFQHYGNNSIAYCATYAVNGKVLVVPTPFGGTGITADCSFISNGVRLTFNQNPSETSHSNYIRVTAMLFWDIADAHIYAQNMNASATETVTAGLSADLMFLLGAHGGSGTSQDIAVSWGCSLPLADNAAGSTYQNRCMAIGSEYGAGSEVCWSISRSGQAASGFGPDGSSSGWYAKLNNVTATQYDIVKAGGSHSGRFLGVLAIEFTNKPNMTLGRMWSGTGSTSLEWGDAGPVHYPTIKVGGQAISNGYGVVANSGTYAMAGASYLLDRTRSAVTYASWTSEYGSDPIVCESNQTWSAFSSINWSGLGDGYLLTNGTLYFGTDGASIFTGVTSAAPYYGWELSLSAPPTGVWKGDNYVDEGLKKGSTDLTAIYKGSTQIV